jgi:hypothetical protein
VCACAKLLHTRTVPARLARHHPGVPQDSEASAFGTCGAARRRLDGIRLRYTRSLDSRRLAPRRHPRDVVGAHGPRPRGDLPPRAFRRMLRQSLAEGRVSVRQLAEVVQRTPRHRGAGALRAVIADGYVPTRSELEDRALDLLEHSGIERPRGQRGAAARPPPDRARPPVAPRARRRGARRRDLARRPPGARRRRRAAGGRRGERLSRAAGLVAPARRAPAPDDRAHPPRARV